MIDEVVKAFLERGCAIIVGTVAPDGLPHAQRAWGCTVVGPATVRTMVDATDAVLRSHLDAGGRIAVTAAHVRTLQSVQLKGTVVAVEEPTPDDLARCEAHNDEVFTDIHETDHFPRELVERMVPPAYVTAVVEVEELFDQTPGPTAGAPGVGALR